MPAAALFGFGAAILGLGTGCRHRSYEDALGYRARQAALAKDVEAFDVLMEEAAREGARPPLYDPTRTVLVHFFDLAGDARFTAKVRTWKARGWVSEAMACAILRARWRAAADRDTVLADRLSGQILERARSAARNPKRTWEVAACLEDAAFLSGSSSTSWSRYVERVQNLNEPLAFRRALLEGLAALPVETFSARSSTSSTAARGRLERAAARLDGLMEDVRTTTAADTLVAYATSESALRLERFLLPFATSYVARYARAFDPLAWAWVRSMKVRKKRHDLESLGLWNYELEGKGDAYWYVCAASDHVEQGEPRRARAHRFSERLEVPMDCPRSIGPFPLEASARAAAIEAWSPGRPGALQFERASR